MERPKKTKKKHPRPNNFDSKNPIQLTKEDTTKMIKHFNGAFDQFRAENVRKSEIEESETSNESSTFLSNPR